MEMTFEHEPDTVEANPKRRVREMPRTAAVRYFMDDKSGRLVIVDRGDIREMKEIGGKGKRGPKPKDPMAPADVDGAPKKRGRPKKKAD